MAINNVLNKIITPTPTANAIAQFDSNAALHGNSLIPNSTTTARSATSYTITVASTQTQIFTGNGSGGSDYIELPATTTLANGQSYTFINTSTLYSLTAYNGSFDQIMTIPAGGSVILTCIDNSSDVAASWSVLSVPVSFQTFSSPTITFSTPGNLSVSYSSQSATLTQLGGLMVLQIDMRFTPTYTSASGNLIIQNLPAGIGNGFDAIGGGGILVANGLSGASVTPFAYPASCTVVVPNLQSNFGSPIVTLQGMGSSQYNTLLGVTQFPTATAKYFRLQFVVPN